MPKQTLPTNFKDDVPSVNMHGQRRYNRIYNSDNTVSFSDVTEYEQVGDDFGAAQVNAMNQAINESLAKDGDASNTTNSFVQAGSRENLTTGEKISISLGKIKKWFSDLKPVAFSGSYNDLSNKPVIIDNLSDVIANTTSGKIAGALSMKALNNNLLNYLSLKGEIPSTNLDSIKTIGIYKISGKKISLRYRSEGSTYNTTIDNLFGTLVVFPYMGTQMLFTAYVGQIASPPDLFFRFVEDSNEWAKVTY